MLNNNLKFCRETLEMTQKELGYVFGVTEATMSNWENGNDNMPLKKLVKFCNLYNYSLDFVLGLKRDNTEYNKLEKLNSTNIGNNLKKIRQQLNISQKDFAKNVKISNTTLCNFESGYRLINSISLYSICKTYNISADELLGRKKK